MANRRRTDPPSIIERRRSLVDRRAITQPLPRLHLPTRQEQAFQFLTRYLFALLGLLFFNLSAEFHAKWMALWQINVWLVAHILVNTVNFIHAWLKPVSPARYRFALWVDIFTVTACVANDPYEIPPSLVAYIVVVLGNGMRYGMRFFGEALCGSLLGGGFGMGIRYMSISGGISLGTVFLSLFGVIIVVYAYILMGRVEQARYRSEEVSRTDPLTGLFNRRGLNEAIDSWLVNAQWKEHKPVVMFADLDNFKTVNDTYGHAEGDRALTVVATLLQQAVRSSDLIARYGGDEFVLLLADANPVEADVIAKRIQHKIENWFCGETLPCGISIGFAEVSSNNWNLEKVLQSVDQLLYQSKAERAGKGLRGVGLA
ncbi:MAG: GGDEF domain-containing protein [Pseudomonadota bacterium]